MTYFSIEVGCHEPTLAGQGLVRGEALHVGILEQAGQVVCQVTQARVHRHL